MEKNFVWTDEFVNRAILWCLHYNENLNMQMMKDEFSKEESKQPKKDWEIIEFLGNYKEKVTWQGEDKHGGFNYKQWYECALAHNYTIHSVRRHDNVVFTIGDKVEYNIDKIVTIEAGTYKFTIKSFYIKSNSLMASQHESDTWGVNISVLSKVKEPIPLFTTEDGVNKYKGDNCWYWDSKSDDMPSVWYSLPEPLILLNNTDISGYKYFSTKEAAYEYILLNHPQLSIQDVMNQLSSYFQNPALAFEAIKSFVTFKNKNTDGQF